jgi:PAS domain S-box-containing protein
VSEKERSGARILVVDDSPLSLQLLTGLLVQGGYEVRAATTGSDALDVARNELVDLILLDLVMPEMDGLAVIEQLKSDGRTRDLPVIIISGRDDPEEKVKAFSLGAVDYVTKPYHAAELLARVQTQLALQALQRMLQTSEARYRAVVQDQTELICRCLPDNTINFVNDAFCRFFSQTYHQLMGRKMTDLLIPEDRARVEEQLCRLTPSQHIGTADGRVLLSDGSQRWLRWTNRAIFDEENQLVERQSVGRDITEELRAQAVRRRSDEMEAIAEERRRIAQETHDGLVQNLAGLRLQVNRWHRMLDEDPSKMHAELDWLREVLEENIQELRRTILALRPIDLAERGILPALRKLCTDLGELYRVRVKLDFPASLGPLPPSQELTLFRIVQEALNNAGKHAAASTIWVKLAFQGEDTVVVTVRDDGRGLRSTELQRAAKVGHLGLRQMRERAEAAGGDLTIESEPGKGTQIQVCLPHTGTCVQRR